MSPRLGLQLKKEVLPCKPSVFSPISFFFLSCNQTLQLCFYLPSHLKRESKYEVKRHMAVSCLRFYSSLSTKNGENERKNVWFQLFCSYYWLFCYREIYWLHVCNNRETHAAKTKSLTVKESVDSCWCINLHKRSGHIMLTLLDTWICLYFMVCFVCNVYHCISYYLDPTEC